MKPQIFCAVEHPELSQGSWQSPISSLLLPVFVSSGDGALLVPWAGQPLLGPQAGKGHPQGHQDSQGALETPSPELNPAFAAESRIWQPPEGWAQRQSLSRAAGTGRRKGKVQVTLTDCPWADKASFSLGAGGFPGV